MRCIRDRSGWAAPKDRSAAFSLHFLGYVHQKFLYLVCHFFGGMDLVVEPNESQYHGSGCFLCLQGIEQDMLVVSGDNGGKVPVWDPNAACYIMASVSYQQMLKVKNVVKYV